MKGVVFTELIEFIESAYGFDAVDAMIEESGVSGVYTQVGTYPFEELVSLVSTLAKQQKTEIPTLLEFYGKHLFGVLVSLYPHFDQFHSSFEVITKVDKIIHPEVHKLYPEAELPTFMLKEESLNRLLLEYQSNKKLQHLAKGLMVGAGEYYGENISVTLHEEGSIIKIEVTRDAG